MMNISWRAIAVKQLLEVLMDKSAITPGRIALLPEEQP